MAHPARTGRTPLEMVLSRRLRQYREGKGLTVRALALAAGVSPSLVHGVEAGTCTASLAAVQSLADALEVSPVMLLEAGR